MKLLNKLSNGALTVPFNVILPVCVDGPIFTVGALIFNVPLDVIFPFVVKPLLNVTFEPKTTFPLN